MEKFNPSEGGYRKKLADNLRAIKEVSPKKAENTLKIAQETNAYKAEKAIHSTKSADVQYDWSMRREQLEEDMQKTFKCELSEIARTPNEINENTKAYVGILTPGIFGKFPSTIEHIYTSFPEGKIEKLSFEFGGKTIKQLDSELEDKNVKIKGPDLAIKNTSRDYKKPEHANIVLLSVRDMGLKSSTLKEIFDQAKKLGLELCQQELIKYLRLKYHDDDNNDGAQKYVATEPLEPLLNEKEKGRSKYLCELSKHDGIEEIDSIPFVDNLILNNYDKHPLSDSLQFFFRFHSQKDYNERILKEIKEK